MSFFRPDSPPPRMPSPEFHPAPLPHPRRQPSQPRIRVHSPLSRAQLHAMRSMDLTTERAGIGRELGDSPDGVPWTRQRTQSTHTSRSTPTPRSSPGLSPCPSPRSRIPSPVGPKRTLSVSFPSPAPSPTPTMVSPFSPPSKSTVACASNGIACPQPVSLKPIMFEQTEGLGIADRYPTKHLQQKPSKSSLRSLPPLGKPKHVGIACLRFFGIKTHPKQLPGDVTGL